MFLVDARVRTLACTAVLLVATSVLAGGNKKARTEAFDPLAMADILLNSDEGEYALPTPDWEGAPAAEMDGVIGAEAEPKRAKIDTDEKPEETQTPSNNERLLDYAKNGETSRCFEMVCEGADINCVNEEGETPLFIAAYFKHLHTCRALILAGASISAAFKGDRDFALKDYYELLEFVISQTNQKLDDTIRFGEDQSTLLHLAVRDPDLCQAAIRRGFCVHARDAKNLTPLHLAQLMGADETCEVLIAHGALDDGEYLTPAKNNDGSSCKRLLDSFDNSEGLGGSFRGVNLHFGKRQRTLLHTAAMKGHVDLVQLFLDRGANVGIVDLYSNTALHLASNRGHTEVVRRLIGRGADASLKNQEGSTSLHAAALCGHADACRTLISSQVDLVNSRDENDLTPLHIAAANGHLAVCRLLVENGAQVDAMSPGRDSPLSLAATQAHPQVCAFLIEKGADVNTEDSNGSTPLAAVILRVGINETHPHESFLRSTEEPSNLGVRERRDESRDILFKNGGEVYQVGPRSALELALIKLDAPGFCELAARAILVPPASNWRHDSSFQRGIVNTLLVLARNGIKRDLALMVLIRDPQTRLVIGQFMVSKVQHNANSVAIKNTMKTFPAVFQQPFCEVLYHQTLMSLNHILRNCQNREMTGTTVTPHNELGKRIKRNIEQKLLVTE